MMDQTISPHFDEVIRQDVLDVELEKINRMHGSGFECFCFGFAEFKSDLGVFLPLTVKKNISIEKLKKCFF